MSLIQQIRMSVMLGFRICGMLRIKGNIEGKKDQQEAENLAKEPNNNNSSTHIQILQMFYVLTATELDLKFLSKSVSIEVLRHFFTTRYLNFSTALHSSSKLLLPNDNSSY